MELSKTCSLIDISTKPRNQFTRNALKEVVAWKGKLGTIGFIRVPTTLMDMKGFQGHKSQALIKVHTADGKIEMKPIGQKKEKPGAD